MTIHEDHFKQPQCTGVSLTTGLRCRRRAIAGGSVCKFHGGSLPSVAAAAKLRLLAMSDPALDLLLDAMDVQPKCEVCGRTDDKSIAVRAAIAVLDRSGLGPHAHIHTTPDADPSTSYTAWLTEDELMQVAEIIQRGQDRMKAAAQTAIINVTPVKPKELGE